MKSDTLDAAQRQREQLVRNYRASKAKQLAELYADPEIGARLHKFVKTLGHYGIDDSERWIAYVGEQCRKWLRAAPEDVRFAALEACDERIMKIRMKAGLAPIDDPLMDEDDDVFKICKKAIGL